jgi:hypothetical protein
MTRCIYCGTEVGKGIYGWRMHKLDGRVFEFIWCCPKCSGESWAWDSGVKRRYSHKPFGDKDSMVPDGVLFVSASEEL